MHENDATKRTAIYKWQERFCKGRTNIEDDPRIAFLEKSREKVMLEVFFDYESIIYYEFIPEGQIVDK